MVGNDRQWYCYHLNEEKLTCLTKGCEVSFAEEAFDRPMFVPAYGIAGWTEGEKDILIYDRYDIWKVSPDGKSIVNLTQGQGRKANYTFRYLNTKQLSEFEKDYMDPKGTILLTVFDNTTMKNGYATLKVDKANAPIVRTLDGYTFSMLQKAKNANGYIYLKENFSTSPDVYFSPNLWKHAGAPVSNMTSAYGGIRWESGECRQFQYEHTQSRMGKSLWEAPELYIANSPLFKADKVETPLLIMHNDKDGAVPWYQGIEFFTALRRLGKPVWMLQYNDEAHNLVERRNRKDLSIRLQQFFDHYLKAAPMPAWLKDGIPAVRKGESFGFESNGE